MHLGWVRLGHPWELGYFLWDPLLQVSISEQKTKGNECPKINLAYKYFVVDYGQIDSNLPLSEYVANLRQYTINRSDIVGRPRKFFFFSFSSPYSLLEPYH